MPRIQYEWRCIMHYSIDHVSHFIYNVTIKCKKKNQSIFLIHRRVVIFFSRWADPIYAAPQLNLYLLSKVIHVCITFEDPVTILLIMK